MARMRRQEHAANVQMHSRTRDQINDMAMLISGAAIGAMAMYIFDADRGARRRALARDKMVHWLKIARLNARRRAEDWKNRAVGAVMETRSRWHDAHEAIPDDVLEQRVRAQVGHVVGHPGALEIRAENGRVIVSGPVLAGEREKIERRMRQTRGVREFELRVDEHASKEGIPALQGESRFERRQAH